jgi:hypothetical protein
MTIMNLTEVPREELPRLVEAIIDKKASIYFYMRAHSTYEFLRDDGELWPSQTGRYELKDPAHIVDELQRLYRGQGLGGISVPEILDKEQRTHYVVRSDDDGRSLNADGTWLQGINLVRFPYDQFQVEWIDDEKKTSRARDTGYLVKEFLRDHPTGGKPDLLRWLSARSEVKEITKDSITWTDPMGRSYSKSLKTILNLVSEYR